MKKTLNTTGIINELRGESSFFPQTADNHSSAPLLPHQTPDVSLPPQDHEQTAGDVPSDGSNQGINERSNVGSNERKEIRHTFDIFADQLLSLREIAITREKTFGKRALLGDLVQEALDMFITKERQKE